MVAIAVLYICHNHTSSGNREVAFSNATAPDVPTPVRWEFHYSQKDRCGDAYADPAETMPILRLGCGWPSAYRLTPTV